ncbi:hypothetical protein GCM10010193_69850 [Kitasatospora atroaurantiaca]|uniref:Uncharacterized protein n=1 Tax=Kitasatospora atroaurantiaca TaxID=285545 RepID=A0A561EN69_9ACTN|nr:hypothetical protein [Kitasatospora atroaurantiaca]TWE17071.1 hypothetical protein FB465_2075 [Kitasatospora atroaurantiaca]
MNGRPQPATDPVDRIVRIVRTIENATVSQLKEAFHRLGWPLLFTVTEAPQSEIAEEPTR